MIEKLEGTLEDYLLVENFKEEVLISCLFQIAFALTYLQKYYEIQYQTEIKSYDDFLSLIHI